MNQTEMTMGRRIAARRRELKMTQDALAQELGVSPQAVSKWENDLSCPDIAILPRLAKILGMTTDALLGAEPEIPEPQAVEDAEDEEEDTRPGIHVETNGSNRFDIHFDPPRRVSFSGAAWLIMVGLLMLAGPLMKNHGWDTVGFWSACWISALIVWGVGGMLRRVKVSNVLMTLAGVYFALSELNLFHLKLGWDILFPGVILVFGLCLLLEGLGKKRRGPMFRISGPGRVMGAACQVEDGYLSCNGSFLENTYRVQTGELKGGDVSLSFCEFVLDFSGVERVAENCCIDLNACLGEVELKVPARYRLELSTSKAFGDTSFRGHPDPEPEGVIYVDANLSFGELRVHYI